MLFLPKSDEFKFYVYNTDVYTRSCFFQFSQSRKLECCQGFVNTKGKCEGKENIKKYSAIYFCLILVSMISHIQVSAATFDKVINLFLRESYFC